MPTVNLHFLGRFGNQMFEYAFARGYCERHGFTLTTDPWPGERIFMIEHARGSIELPRRDENSLVDGEGDVSYRSYSQRAKCAAYYTRAQVRSWFTFRPEIEEALRILTPGDQTIAAHLRRGDYVGSGSIYPTISKESYLLACDEHGLDRSKLHWLSDDCPTVTNEFCADLGFVPDLFVMSKAKTLLRANSSFSWWAGAIGNGRVFSPVIDGLVGGMEHDNVRFVEGLHPRIADIDFVDSITIKPE